jgi:heavy metal sensor kinase
MMSRARSLRVRVATWSAFIFTAGLTAVIGLIWIEARHALNTVFDGVLQDRLLRYRAQLDQLPPEALPQLATLMSTPGSDAPAGMIVELRVDGRRLFAAAPYRTPQTNLMPWPAVSTEDAPVSQNITLTSGALYRAVGVRLRDSSPAVDAFMALPLGPVAEVLRREKQQLFWLVPLVIVLSAAGGYWVSGRALAPIRKVVAAAQSTSVRHLSERVAVPDSRDTIEELTRTFNDMLDRIELPVRRQEQFVADASHELRTPLAAIRNTAELALERPRTADSYREALADVLRESESLSRMVEQLLLLARSDARESLPLTRIDLSELCADAAADCEVLLDAQDKRFRVLLTPQKLVVGGHAESLRRMIIILLDNAIKYTAERAEIVLRTGADCGRPFIEVSDTGMGIAAEDLPRIFERFYRVDRARSRATQGFGLGLAIARAIAQNHRAEILVASRVGQGSTFRIWFPATDEAA